MNVAHPSRLVGLLLLYPAVAGAQTQAAGSEATQGLMNLLPFFAMFVAVYFLLLRPANKQRQEQQDLLAALKKDDQVVTQSGLIGRISALEPAVVTLEVADKVRIRVLRSAIAGLYPPPAKSAAAKPAPEAAAKQTRGA